MSLLDVFEKIKELKTAYAVMEKFRILYGKKTSEVQYLMKKMYSVKAKNRSGVYLIYLGRCTRPEHHHFCCWKGG